jgi:capsule biosynthesis phosphatase
MIILIPLGGLGKRFKEVGYSLPKPLINVFGKPILFWLLDNLKFSNQIDFIYIPYNIELERYRFEDRIRQEYPHFKFKFFKLKNNTRGAAETVKISLDNLDGIKDQPIISMDGDNFYSYDIINNWCGKNLIYSFNDNNSEPIYSYVKLDEFQNITDIKEKIKISDYACTGAYGFNSWKDLLENCNEIIEKKILKKNEFYLSTVIKNMINKNVKFITKTVRKEQYFCLGTPIQVRIFCENNYQLCEKKRYCFDLDNTLITFSKKHNDYSTVEPIQKNIDFVKKLKSLGNTIIIHTARRMRTHKGDVGKIIKDVGKLTLDTLEKFDIPYDEFYFGKPHAHFYIDDKGLSEYRNLEFELGFYNNSTIEPREFNTIDQSSIQIFKKKSNKSLEGEIFYYSNIPLNLRNMFPKFISHDGKFMWYEIEKIEGITFSKMYVEKQLLQKHIDKLFDNIQKIHQSKIKLYELDNNLNYLKKLENRYKFFDYSQFKNSEVIYNNLIKFFKNYHLYNSSDNVMIHGDPVFTNIILDKNENIKFIDMRGKIGEINSIEGDWLYDWAKIYQSLIGYDEIMHDIRLDNDYKMKLIMKFKNRFINTFNMKSFENLQNITKSHLFTLIPLHNNKKCKLYFELINSVHLK